MKDPQNKSTILIVDDTPENLDVLKGALRDDYKVRPAIHGEIALKLAAMEPQPDLILLDIMMPEIDGYEVCRRLKESGRTRNIPVIFVTAKSTVQDELRGLELGAVDYIQKPISPPVVKARVKTHLALQQARYELEEKNARLYEINERLTSSLDQLSASEERFRNLVQTIPDIVYKLDSEGRFTFVNKSIERLGYHQSELIGRHFSMIIHEDDIKKSAREHILSSNLAGMPNPEFKMFDERRSGSRMTSGLEIRLKSKSGRAAESAEIRIISDQTVSVEVNSSGLYGEVVGDTKIEKSRNYVGTVGVIRDITERNRILAKLKQAREQAEAATRLKDQFVSLVSHDLRAPLSSIVGLLEYIVYDEDNPLHSSHKSLLQGTLTTGRNLNQMIEEILNVGRLQTGKIAVQMSFFDAHFLAQDILQRIDYVRSGKNIHIDCTIPKATRFYGDPTLIGEVLQNLLTNAIKFSQAGATVQVFVPTGDHSAIAVQDKGMGIPAHVIPKLFNISEKVSTLGTAGEQGTGFGLPFSLDIMEAHGGKLAVQSIEEEGSTFTMTLPFVQPRILVVDDEVTQRALLTRMLRPLQAELFEASNGHEAMEAIIKNKPHLILSDVFMPGMDGFQLLEQVKQSSALKDIPFVLITGDREEETRLRAFRMGAADFANKPLEAHDFLPRVRHFMGS